jgi:hypothetical protein
MDDLTARITALLQQAAETHHAVYRITDGEDPDWASWYADWLIGLSALPALLGSLPVRSELVWLLVQLDKEYGAESRTSSWPEWYATRLLSHLGATEPVS